MALVGNAQIGETHSCEYDTVSNIIICGTQDTGTTEQVTSGGLTWRQAPLLQGDGGVVAVDDTGASSIRFFSTNNLGNFRRRTCDAANTCGAAASVGLNVTGTMPAQNIYQYEGCAAGTTSCLQFYPPIVLNSINPARLAIGTNRVYESNNRGDNITDLTGNTGSNITRAIAYGGTSGGVANAEVLYYGNNAGVFLRTTAGGAFTQLAAYPGGTPVDLVLDPDDWRTAYVADSDQVFQTTDAGATWTDITGNIGAHTPGVFRTVEFIENANADAILVGTDTGVFVTRAGATLGSSAELGATLPNAIVFELRYDAVDNVLLAATMGRGSWTLANASNVIGVADLEVVSFAPVSTPPQLLLGQDTNVTFRTTVANNGPTTPVNAVTTATAVSPGVTVTPNPLVRNINALAVGSPQTFDQTFTVKCTTPGVKTVTLTQRIDAAAGGPVDPNPANNAKSASFSADCLVPVALNIRPGNKLNRVVPPDSRGVPMVVLTTTAGEYGLPIAFDAANILPATTRWGTEALVLSGGGQAEKDGKGELKKSVERAPVSPNENLRDGDFDMYLEFAATNSGLVIGDTKACIVGSYLDPATNTQFRFFGCDIVFVEPSQPGP